MTNVPYIITDESGAEFEGALQFRDKKAASAGLKRLKELKAGAAPREDDVIGGFNWYKNRHLLIHTVLPVKI